jgi:hypothetical protein
MGLCLTLKDLDQHVVSEFSVDLSLLFGKEHLEARLNVLVTLVAEEEQDVLDLTFDDLNLRWC